MLACADIQDARHRSRKACHLSDGCVAFQLFGTYVSLETELLAMNIFPERVHVDNMGSTVRGHLSLQMSLKVSHETAPPAHGVLGQTIDPALTATIEVSQLMITQNLIELQNPCAIFRGKSMSRSLDAIKAGSYRIRA